MFGTERQFCCFTLDEKQYLGELVLNGESSLLQLHSRHHIPYTPEPQSLYGETLDYQKISLFDCVGESPSAEGTYPNFAFQRATFPHYAAIGARHIGENEALFRSVSFRTDDLGLIFAARGTFGSAHPDKDDLQCLLDKSFQPAWVEVANNPLIFYFTGTKDAIDTDISSGLFSAALEFEAKTSDHTGIQCNSDTKATLKFSQSKTLLEVVEEVFALSLFITTIAGRCQGISNLTADIFESSPSTMPSAHEKMAIHWSFAPTISRQAASSIRDIPITPQIDQVEFYQVFRQWRQRHKEWLPSRLRIINLQKFGREYDENRLVAAANAFDILPNSVYPDSGELSSEATKAKKDCQAIIQSLKPGPERDQISNTLAFWGGRSLRLKTLSRSQVVRKAIGGTLDDLDDILKVAILARNYFVHGSNKFGWDHYSHLIAFFTDALEFVFVASDLIECGWNAENWVARTTGHSHPLSAFIKGYTNNATAFRLAEESAKQ